jgi:hypothetical protein
MVVTSGKETLMVRKLVWIVVLLVAGAGSARAAGVDLGWNDCPGGETYSASRTFACDSDAGAHTLVASFVAPAGILKMSANEITIDVQTSGEAVPDWWKMSSGLCRSVSLTCSVDFSDASACYDFWQGAGIGAVHAYAPVNNGMRIRGLVAIPSTSPLIRPVPEGTRVYSFKTIISNLKTAGPGSCGGCATPACIVLTSITLNQPPPLSMPVLTSPVTSQHVTWQSGTICGDLSRVTPVRRESWGAIKALYH